MYVVFQNFLSQSHFTFFIVYLSFLIAKPQLFRISDGNPFNLGYKFR